MHYLHKVRVYLTTLVIIINFPDKYQIHFGYIMNYVPFENYHREINIINVDMETERKGFVFTTARKDQCLCYAT